jgi:hypothetical protein
MGLGAKLIRKTLPLEGTPFVELIAVMADPALRTLVKSEFKPCSRRIASFKAISHVFETFKPIS